MAEDLHRLTEAIEQALRAKWDYIDIGPLHDDEEWTKLATDAAAAALEVLAPSEA